MIKYIVVIAASSFVISFFVGAFWQDNIHIGIRNSMLCEFSIYNTSDYQLIGDVLYCRSSPNSFQMLKKPTPRSPHLNTHKKGVK